ncbi:MAG: sugar phosphate isomerase/epimerase [Desulfatitalea sp.]|nr:sugar phosphate isomerase/epimerase [Desulfatitalea sp.]MBI5896851.1 sugar phosphate isomerase/epimerase [Desulfobacterales bacterium]
MRYGVMNAPMRPLLQEIEALGPMGFDYLEITMDAPHAHHGVILDQKAAIGKALGRFDLALVCHLPTFVSTADLTDRLREASLEEMVSSLRAAAELHPLKVVLHPSFIHGLGAMMPDIAQQHAEAAMTRLLNEAERLKLTVCVENMFPRALYLVRPEEFDALFATHPAARLTLDTGHAHIGGGTQRILAFIERFGGRIGHIHASDNFGRDDDHLPIGAGTIDFARVARALQRAGYDDTITLEVFSRDRDYLRISREKLAAMFTAK